MVLKVISKLNGGPQGNVRIKKWPSEFKTEKGHQHNL